MALSMFGVCASATDVKDYSDYDKITYTEAVGVLSGLGVLQGDDTGTFRPTATLKRSEAAKVITYLKGLQNENVSEGTKFTDVKGMWAEKFVTIAANAGIIAGMGDGTFAPDALLTGYQWEKMVLCALGYDAEIEKMVGANYEGAVADLAKAKKLLDGLDPSYDATKAITREEAAQIAFNGLKALTVVYDFTGATNDKAGDTQFTLGYKEFGLHGDNYADKWGRPGTQWYNRRGDVVHTEMLEPVDSFTVAKSQCDIATTIGLRKTANDVEVYLDGVVQSDTVINPTATRAMVGDQGTLVEVYETAPGKYREVIIETFLAKVTDVKAATYDQAGHKKTDASITFDLYGSFTPSITLTDPVADYTYVKDDYILVNFHNGDNEYKATSDYTKSDIVGLAKTADGKITAYDSKTTTIDDTKYNDACKWFLGNVKDAKPSTFFFDQYGNVIGRIELAQLHQYGIIKDIQWINPTGAAGYAQATMLYMDGAVETAKIASIEGFKTAYNTSKIAGACEDGKIYVSTDMAENVAEFNGVHLYDITTGPNGLELKLADQVTADVVTGKSQITSGVLTNSKTLYLIKVQNGPMVDYKFVTGYNNVETYKGATVDYVMDGTYAKYVYIIGDAEASMVTSLFFPTKPEPTITYDQAGMKTYTYEGYVDGVMGEIVTKEPAAASITNGTLNFVKIVNGVAVEAIESASSGDALPFTGTVMAAPYAPGTKVQFVNAADIVDITEGVLNTSYGQFNIEDFTPNMGEFAMDAPVWLIYHFDGVQNVVTQAYVLNPYVD